MAKELPVSIQILAEDGSSIREFSIGIPLSRSGVEISHFNYTKVHTPAAKPGAKAFCAYKVAAYDNDGKVLGQSTVNFQLAAGATFGGLLIEPQDEVPAAAPFVKVSSPPKSFPPMAKKEAKTSGPIKPPKLPSVGPSALAQPHPFSGMPGSPTAHPANNPYQGNYGFPGEPYPNPMHGMGMPYNPMGMMPPYGAPYWPRPPYYPQYGEPQPPQLMAPDAFRTPPAFEKPAAQKPASFRPPPVTARDIDNAVLFDPPPFDEAEIKTPARPAPAPAQAKKPAPTGYRAAASQNLAGSKPPGPVRPPMTRPAPRRQPRHLAAKPPADLPADFGPWYVNENDPDKGFPGLANNNCFAFDLQEPYPEMRWEYEDDEGRLQVCYLAEEFPLSMRLALLHWRAGIGFEGRCQKIIDGFLEEFEEPSDHYPDFPKTAAWMAAFHYFARLGKIPLCFNWNAFRHSQKCKFFKLHGKPCPFKHVCYLCGGDHGMFDRTPPPHKQVYICETHRRLRAEKARIKMLFDMEIGEFENLVRKFHKDYYADPVYENPAPRSPPREGEEPSLLDKAATQAPNPFAPDPCSSDHFPALPVTTPETQSSPPRETVAAAASPKPQPKVDADGFQKPTNAKKKKGKAGKATKAPVAAAVKTPAT